MLSILKFSLHLAKEAGLDVKGVILVVLVAYGLSFFHDYRIQQELYYSQVIFSLYDLNNTFNKHIEHNDAFASAVNDKFRLAYQQIETAERRLDRVEVSTAVCTSLLQETN